jgi:hypothetical protein
MKYLQLRKKKARRKPDFYISTIRGIKNPLPLNSQLLCQYYNEDKKYWIRYLLSRDYLTNISQRF